MWTEGAAAEAERGFRHIPDNAMAAAAADDLATARLPPFCPHCLTNRNGPIVLARMNSVWERRHVRKAFTAVLDLLTPIVRFSSTIIN